MQKRLGRIKSISSMKGIFSLTGEGNAKDKELVPSIAARLEKADDGSLQNLDEFLVWSNSKKSISRTSNARPQSVSCTDHKNEAWLHELERVRFLPTTNLPLPLRPQRPDDAFWLGLTQSVTRGPNTTEAREHRIRSPKVRPCTAPLLNSRAAPIRPSRPDDDAWPRRPQSSAWRPTTARIHRSQGQVTRDNVPPPFTAKGPPIPERAVSLEQEKELDTWWLMLSVEEKMAIKGRFERSTEGFI